MRNLLGNIEFVDAKKEQAHRSVVIKTTVRLPLLLLSALGKALPWEYQVGRLVLFQIQEQEGGKESFYTALGQQRGCSAAAAASGDPGSFSIWRRRQD